MARCAEQFRAALCLSLLICKVEMIAGREDGQDSLGPGAESVQCVSCSVVPRKAGCTGGNSAPHGPL